MKLFRSKTLNFVWCAIVIAAMSPARLQACAVCYGESDAPMARGVTWAILALAGIVACVLSGVVVFFVHTQRKSSAQAKLKASAESNQRND